MDIISEILETDRLADEKIIAAHRRQAELEHKTDAEIASMRSEVEEKAQAYKKKLESRTKAETDAQLSKAEKEEQEKIAKIDDLYASKHKKWEKVITEKIISG